VQRTTPYLGHPQPTAEPADISRASSGEPEFVTEKMARQNFMSLAGKTGFLVENPLAFLERALQHGIGQLQLRKNYNAVAYVDCLAILSHRDGRKFKGLGRGDDKVRSIRPSLLSKKVLTRSRRAL
jgi:hypothetical protein